MNKISERCPHCGAPAGTTCAEWNSGIELKNGCPPREGAGAYVPAQLREFVRRGADAQRAVDALIPAVDAKLIVHRLRKLSAHISNQAGVDVRERASMLRELNELADQVEEQFELLAVDGFR